MWALLLACRAEPEIVDVPPPEPADAPLPDTPPVTVYGEPVGLCINELMPVNVASVHDDLGGSSDWIELHNPTDTDVALDGWSVTDDPDEPDKHVLDGGQVIAAGGFLVLWADDEPGHLGFGLSEEGEAVGVFDPDGNGTVVSYGPTTSDLAIARITDCCFEPEGCFGYRFAGTPGATNGD